MIIYLIEDDDLKATRLIEYINTYFPKGEISRFFSYQSGLRALQQTLPDLLLLDMTIPTFDPGPKRREGRPRSLGGKDIMRKMLHGNLNTKVVVVTQFGNFGEGDTSINCEQLKQSCKQEFPGLFCGLSQYHASSTDWRLELDEILESAFRT